MRKISILIVLLCPVLFALAQKNGKEPVTKIGKISVEDLEKKVYSIDSSAPAVVLFDVGETRIIGNRKGSFSLEFRHRKRIHILQKSGYSHAEVSISQYRDGESEARLEGLKAYTYNLENGKVAETKLEKSSVFKEQVDKNYSRTKFTFPNVKEGSIIEYEYTISSDFIFNLMPWSFQGEIPRLWSEYEFSLPQFLNYLFLAQGYFPFHIKENKDRFEQFRVSESGGVGLSELYTFNANVTDYRWVMKDVPGLKAEKFTSTIDNHIAKIEFQLSGYQHPLNPRSIMASWPEVVKSLMEREDFGKLVNANNGWLSGDVDAIVKGVESEEAKARKIYEYVRDHYSCTSHHSLIPDQNLKNVVKTGKGTVSEINMLLIAMLRQANIMADPVLLSTRDNGYANTVYPMINCYNYVVCQAAIGGKQVFLDATHPRLGFGRLPYECYNGVARVIQGEAPAVELMPDSLQERKFTMVNINIVDKKWQGRVQQTPGYFESIELRGKIKGGKDEFFKEVQKNFGFDVTLKDAVVDSLNNYETPLAMKYDFTLNTNGEDLLYINPMFGEGYKENPFKSAQRLYPVEMPYATDETYVLNMAVPDGYEVDELPKGVRVKLNEEGEGMFEYLFSHSNNVISMRCRIQLMRAFFAPEEYDMLREFYNLIVSKQSEQIVLKKKK